MNEHKVINAIKLNNKRIYIHIYTLPNNFEFYVNE